MKIVGLMLARDEDWVIDLSIPTALRWVDTLIILDHGSVSQKLRHTTDRLERVFYRRLEAEEHWAEMPIRQHMLDTARDLGATHIAVIDADEVPTANLVPDRLHSFFEALEPGEQLELPLIAAWPGLGNFWDDNRSPWARAWLTLGFRDRPDLCWRPRGEEGYQHHGRPPKNSFRGENTRPLQRGLDGGVFHLQYANRKRLVAKHVLYRMSDFLRWPTRLTLEQLNRTYDGALQDGPSSPVPPGWVAGYPVDRVNFDEMTPWHESKIQELLAKYGRERFAGLDLKGY